MKVYLVILLSLFTMKVTAQQIGDIVILSSSNQAGVPVHSADGDVSYVRWPNGTIGKVIAIGDQTHWRFVESNDKSGWITINYLTIKPSDDTEQEEPSNEIDSYVVGSWNLEWFHNSKQRGFPENNNGGPSYGPRTDDDYKKIAATIRDNINAKIFILCEINGATDKKSNELDHLLKELGSKWGYFLSPSSGQQRLAIIFDSNAVKCTKCIEIQISERKIQEKDIFDRDPLVCNFTLLDHSGMLLNDLLVVAVHLASGQGKNINHDTAMAVLSTKLAFVTSNGTFSSSEKDILVAGDFNASRYDNNIETFWDNTSPTSFRFRTLSPLNGEDYPGTRLAGVPLAPKSQIDYIMISTLPGGLIDEVVEPSAQVRVDLLPSDFNLFRQHQSDHIPVTIHIKIVPDND
jgi:hypothetical protein